jgi:hypothetical protein
VHTVEVWANGTDLGIDIDDVTADTETLAGSGVPVTTDNWTISPFYFNYYKQSGSGRPVVSHSDPSASWTDEVYAYDDSLTTYAYAPGGSSGYLELTFDEAFATDTVGLCLNSTETGNTLAVDVYYDSAWNNIYSGAIPNQNAWSWFAIPAGTKTVSQVRLKNTNAIYTLRLLGVEACGGNATSLVWYQPVTLISGTTLLDRQGTAQNGIITWGSNPSGVSVVVGALLPVSTSSAVTPGTTPDAGASLVPATGNISALVSGIEGENLPFYGLFKGLFASYHDMGGPDIQMPYFWKIVAMIIGWGLGTVVLIVTRHVVFGFLGYIIGFAVPAYAMGGLLDPWIPIVYGMTAACLAALLWKWTASAID